MLVILALAAAFAILAGADESPEQPHFNYNSDCNPTKTHIYQQCSFRCSDIMNALNGNESCYLSNQGQVNEAVAMERAEKKTGVCINGECTENSTDRQSP
uniref:Putative secreted protein n=1 Tax=Amblyomma cajennense TaxID=34607 RepID=A0A023FDE2_AMBCJ